MRVTCHPLPCSLFVYATFVPHVIKNPFGKNPPPSFISTMFGDELRSSVTLIGVKRRTVCGNRGSLPSHVHSFVSACEIKFLTSVTRFVTETALNALGRLPRFLPHANVTQARTTVAATRGKRAIMVASPFRWAATFSHENSYRIFYNHRIHETKEEYLPKDPCRNLNSQK